MAGGNHRMSIVARIGVLSLILVVTAFAPTASATGCVDVELRNFGNGLHVIANTGRELAFGFVTGDPGEGVGAVAIITPTLCTGFGVGLGQDDVQSILDDVGEDTPLEPWLVLLPLP